jgi:hypothetical protein
MSLRNQVGYFVFDVESAADGKLISQVRYPGQGLGAEEAIARYRQELLAESDGKRDFIPHTYQIPVAVVIAKVSPDLELLDLVSLDEPEFRSHVMTEQFWRGWDVYRRPTWVSFNGRSFDMPLMELAAYRYGLSLPDWFAPQTRSFEQPRNRYNQRCHLDLLDVMTNHGASRFHGGLNLAAELIGKPGKMNVEGHMVQDMHADGHRQEISDYCRCDVLDTYFVFLRCAVLRGETTLDREQAIIQQAKRWLEEQAEARPVYRRYLDDWQDWCNPWQDAGQPDRAEAPG